MSQTPKVAVSVGFSATEAQKTALTQDFNHLVTILEAMGYATDATIIAAMQPLLDGTLSFEAHRNHLREVLAA